MESSRPERSSAEERILKRLGRMVWIILLSLSFMLVAIFYLGTFGPPGSRGEGDENLMELADAGPVIVDGIDVKTGLVVSEGYEVVKANCTGCHSGKLISQNRMSRERWLETIRWMQETQKLWDLGENESSILDYLEKNYAPVKTGRRMPLTDVEWYDL